MATMHPIATGGRDVSEAVQAWETMRDYAEFRGWTVELTPRGRTKCAKAGSVVFGPGHGASIDAYRELISRLGRIDGFMSGRWPW